VLEGPEKIGVKCLEGFKQCGLWGLKVGIISARLEVVQKADGLRDKGRQQNTN